MFLVFRKANSTRCSQAVSHPSAIQAQRCLTSEIEQEPFINYATFWVVFRWRFEFWMRFFKIGPAHWFQKAAFSLITTPFRVKVTFLRRKTHLFKYSRVFIVYIPFSF